MATAKTTRKAPAQKAAPKTETNAFDATENFAENAQEYFSDFVTNMTGAGEEAREKIEEFSADVRARFEKQQELAADVNAELVDAARTEVSDAVQFASDLGKAKTFADALEVQQAYWSNLFQTRAARTQDLTAKSVDVAKEAFAPFNSNFAGAFDTAAFEKFFRFPAKA